MDLTKAQRNALTDVIIECNHEIDRWTTTRDQLQELVKRNGNAVAQNRAVESMAEAALTTHRELTRTKRPYTKRTPHAKRRPDQGKPLPQVDVPEGMPNLHGMPVRDAIAVALGAAGKALSGKEVTALMIGGGFEMPDTMPPARFIGVQLAGMAKAKAVRKSATGFYSIRG